MTNDQQKSNVDHGANAAWQAQSARWTRAGLSQRDKPHRGFRNVIDLAAIAHRELDIHWTLDIGHSLVIGHWSLVIKPWSFIGHWTLDIGHWTTVIGHSP